MILRCTGASWHRGLRCFIISAMTLTEGGSAAINCKAMVKNQILPFFGNTPLDKITTEAVNNWLLAFKDRNYKNTYANTVFGTLWLMLNEAVNRKILKSNPAAPVKKLWK
jgi:hypothetical protein